MMEAHNSEFILRNEELTILLNLLYLKQNTFFKLYPYLISKNMFEIMLDQEITIRVLLSSKEYNRILEEHELYQFQDIVPSSDVIRDILPKIPSQGKNRFRCSCCGHDLKFLAFIKPIPAWWTSG